MVLFFGFEYVKNCFITNEKHTESYRAKEETEKNSNVLKNPPDVLFFFWMFYFFPEMFYFFKFRRT